MWRSVYTRFYCACISLYFFVRGQITYRVLIDSGSTGSRVYIYSYEGSAPLSTLQEVAHMRVRPALATYYNKFTELKDQIQQLITFATEHVPSDLRAQSHIALKATAGLRVIEEEKQEWIIDSVKRILSSSGFYFDPVETAVLTGEEEALFGLLATNLAYGNFSDAQGGFTLAAADLGGSSKQIAFMLPPSPPYTITVFGREVEIPSLPISLGLGLWSKASQQHYPEECRPDYRLLLPGSHNPIEVFARSIAGLGLVESMYEAFTMLSQRAEIDLSNEHNQTDIDTDADQTRMEPILFYEESLDSCNLDVVGQGWEEDEDNISEELKAIEVEETMAGSLAVCDSFSLMDRRLPQGLSSVNFSSPSSSEFSDVVYNPCAPPGESLFYPESLAHLSWLGTGNFEECANIVKEMVLTKAARESSCMRQVKFPTIIAMDNFPKVLEILRLSIDQPVTPYMIKEAGESMCQRPWLDVMDEFHHRIPEYRAQQACFGAAFIYTIATELYGLQEYDSTSFLPTDSHHSYTIGWPLGATIFAATDIATALVP